jgi:mannosyltransferase OCH1-like enzyme
VVELEGAWRDTNPGWTVHTWREWELPVLRNQVWFDAATSPAQQADIVRLELLQRIGGVYIDTDFVPLRPIEELVEATDFFIASEDGHWLSTGIVGARPAHPFLTVLVDGIGPSILSRPGGPPNEQTGPKYVTARYLDYSRDAAAPPIAIFPPALFYPYHFSEPEQREGPFPEAYAVHEWSMSWTTPEGQRSD